MSTDPSHSPDGADNASSETPQSAEQTAGAERRPSSSLFGPPPEDLAARVAALEAERDEMKERWLRSEAEMANVRARAKRDVDETRQFAVQKFARDVVEAAENLRRGLSSLPLASDTEPEIVTRLRDGFEGVERSFIGLLERNGIVRTDPTGTAFDANLHQAMAEQPSADHAPGTVIQAWSSAWTLNGRLLRPAMVVVAKAAAEPVPDPRAATEAVPAATEPVDPTA